MLTMLLNQINGMTANAQETTGAFILLDALTQLLPMEYATMLMRSLRSLTAIL